MTVEYECTLNIAEYKELGVTDDDFAKAKAAIEKAGYDWYQDDNEVQICGEVDVDDYDTNADDVASEIKWILWNEGEIDADVDTREIEYEPDWDSMPGGYDYCY